MPKKQTVERAKRKAKEGKAPSTQAGEFVREEIHDIREGKHGARSPEQAIAIGLSKARKAGVKLPPPPEGSAAAKKKSTKPSRKKPSAKRARATLKALKREPRSTVSHSALSQKAKKTAAKRGPQKRHEAAMKAVRTKGKAGLKKAARKAAETRQEHAST